VRHKTLAFGAVMVPICFALLACGGGGGGGGGGVGGTGSTTGTTGGTGGSTGGGGGIPSAPPGFGGGFTAPTDPGNPVPAPTQVLPFTSAINQLAVVPGDSKLYLADSFQNAISVFDAATRATVRRVYLPFPPNRIAFPPSTNLAYVVCTSQFRVQAGGAVIDTQSDTVVASIQTDYCAKGIDISPARTELYMSLGARDFSQNTSRLAIFAAPFAGQGGAVPPTAVVPLRRTPGELIVAAGRNKAYVATIDVRDSEPDEVAVIDLVTRSEIAAINLGVDANPVAFALTDDETRLYVANRDANEIVVIDTATDSLVGELPFPPSGTGFTGDGPTALLLSDDDATLVVARAYRSFENEQDENGNIENRYIDVDEGSLPATRFGSLDLSCYQLQLVSDNSLINTDGSTVSVIRTASLTLETTLTVGRSPVALALADNAERYFTASRCEPRIDHFDVVTLTPGRLTTATPATAMAVSSDGSDVFVAHSDSVSVVDAETLAVDVGSAVGNGVRQLLYVDSSNTLYASRPGLNRVDAADLTALQAPVIRSIATGPRPGRLAVDAAGIIYALNLGAPRVPGRSITRIAGTAVLGTIATEDAPTDIAFDGNRAFVTSFGDLVSVSTSQPDLRRGFGDTITVLSSLNATPSSAPFLVEEQGSDASVNGPLNIDYQALGAGQARRLLYSNYVQPALISYDTESNETYRIPVGSFPIAQELRVIDDRVTPRMLVFLLTEGGDDDSRLSVIDPVQVEIDEGFTCEISLDPVQGCIGLGLGFKATSMAVGAGTGGSVVITSFATDRVAIYRIGEILPTDVNADRRPLVVTVGNGPTAVLVRNDGRYAYVANELDGTVSVIDLVSATVSATLSVGGVPISFGEDPSTNRVFVGDRFGATITVILDRAVETSFTLPN